MVLFFIMALNGSREHYFNDLRGQTLNLLVQVDAQESLEGQSEEVGRALESSFVIPRKSGMLVLPPEQLPTNNIGVHPVLSSEVRLPGYRSRDLLRPEDREYPCYLLSRRFSRSNTRI